MILNRRLRIGFDESLQLMYRRGGFTVEVELDRGTMCRYIDEAGGALGATIVNAMWQHARGATSAQKR